MCFLASKCRIFQSSVEATILEWLESLGRVKTLDLGGGGVGGSENGKKSLESKITGQL